MNDEVLVGVVNGRANRAEDSQTRIDGQPVLVAILGDRQAIDELHDEVRKAIGSCSAVQDLTDVGVIEAGKNLPFVAKASGSELCAQLRTDDFQGDFLPVLAVRTNGTINRAHPAHPNFPEDFVCADALARWQAETRFVLGNETRSSLAIQYVGTRLFMCRNEGFQFAPQGWVAAFSIQVGRTLGTIQLQSRFQDGPDSLPFFGRHARGSPPLISRSSQARAEDHLRLTVA